MELNRYNPHCISNQCLQHVIGGIDDNPFAQYEACTSVFGSPDIPMIVTGTDTVVSTTTTTVLYIDIIITTSTTLSTSLTTSTSYSYATETVTEYTSTSVSKVYTIAGAPTALANKKKKRSLKKRRCSCKPKSSSSQSSSHPLSSSAPSPSSVSASATPTALYPIGSNCATPEEYSSACSCITAVRNTVTVPGSTSVLTVTESSVVPSVSTAAVTIIVPTTVIQTVTSTITSTTTGILYTTTTVTINPTETAALVVITDPLKGRRLTVGSSSPQAVSLQASPESAGTQIVIVPGSGQPKLGSNVSLRLYGQNNSSVRNRWIFVTAGTAAAAGHASVICWVDSNAVLSCNAPARGWTRIISCNGEIYMAAPTYVNAACQDISLRLDL